MPASVSVIITCHNYGRFVEDSIRSVLKQDWESRPHEILVVDNESTDDTRQHVEKYAPDVRYIYQKDQGQGGAFNTGFKQSTGEIICFQDADDIWYPGKIARVMEEFARHPEAGFVQHPLEAMDVTGRIIWRAVSFPPPDISLEDLLQGRAQLIGAPGLSIRRSVFEKIYPVMSEAPYCADHYVSTHALFFAPARTVPETLGCFRVHGRNFFQRIDWNPANIESFLAILGHLDRHLDLRLKEHGLHLSPFAKRSDLMARRTKEILLHGWRGRRSEAFALWRRLSDENPASLFLAFKRATLLIAVASPRLYLSLRSVYEELRLTLARMRFLRDG